MSKKTVQKLEVKEIKTYQTSDGKVYDTEEAALEHERLLKNPEEWYKVKILELESEIAGLHITIERLEGKILALESKKFFPSQPHPDISPWHPFQQPFNPTAPTPKLPAGIDKRSPKQIKTLTLPTAAGLKILAPNPPNNNLPITIPIKAPIITIYQLVPAGNNNA